MSKELVSPHPLNSGDTIGIFTPAGAGYIFNEELFTNGIKNLQDAGFKIKLGDLTQRRGSQGYRSGSPQERANELMSLIKDPSVRGLMSTIGGNNSSSLIPYLDFDEIRQSRKMFCGYSDVTSLHLAILKYAGLRTVYGPSAMCWFGEWPSGIQESTVWFTNAIDGRLKGPIQIFAPKKWSNHSRDWSNGDWKNKEREWQDNAGWKILNPGATSGEILPVNFNTLMSSAGTSYWPDLKGKILLIEDMYARLSLTERHLRQLQFMGVFDEITGLLIGKPEVLDTENAPFGYEDLFTEVIGPRNYPIVSNFDCSHTVPMISIPMCSKVQIKANPHTAVEFYIDYGI